MAAILDFSLPPTYLLLAVNLYNTREMSVSKNTGIAFEIVFPTSVELKNEDKLHVISRSQVVVTTSGFEPPYWLSGGC